MLTIDFMNGRRAVDWTAVKESVRDAAQNSNTIMWICDADGYCIFSNDPWYKFSGHQVGQGEGYGWLNAVHPDDRAIVLKSFIDAIARAEPYQLDYRLKRRGDDYEWVSSSAHPFLGEEGEILGYVGSSISRDALLQTRANAGTLLTKRERETINWAAQGLTSEETAVKMGINRRTVETFLTSSAEKLSTTNRTQTVVEAVRRGEIVL